jgi:hypothetical protein
LIGYGEETPSKTLELMAGFVIGQVAAVHLHEVACSGQCSADPSRENYQGARGTMRARGKTQRASPGFCQAEALIHSTHRPWAPSYRKA